MFNQFIQSLHNQGKSDLTIKQYRSSWARFLRWTEFEGGYTTGDGGTSCWREATQLDIANFKKWASSCFKPRTVSLNLIHLGVFFR